MTKAPERGGERQRRPPYAGADLDRALLATTIRHVDEDGNVRRMTFFEIRMLIRQQRDDEARMARELRAAVLRRVREDRAAHAAFLEDERERERSLAKFWAVLRVPVRKQRKQPDPEGRRFELEIRRSRARRLPTYSREIIDAKGRRGVYYRARYVSGRKGASYIGCAKASWRYMIRADAVEEDSAGVPSVISNMAIDALEVGACCDLLESVQRAERANAKLFTMIEVNLPFDISPEARIVLLHKFCEEAFGAFDLPYAAVVHHPPEDGDQRNVHAHIMVWWRPTIRIAPYEWQVAKDLATEHDSTEMTMVQREIFAQAMTWASEAEGKKRVYTGLSHAQRGLAITPTVKIGKTLVSAHRRGERVALIERNAETIRRNELILAADRLAPLIATAEEIRRELEDLKRARAALVLPDVSAAPLSRFRAKEIGLDIARAPATAVMIERSPPTGVPGQAHDIVDRPLAVKDIPPLTLSEPLADQSAAPSRAVSTRQIEEHSAPSNPASSEGLDIAAVWPSPMSRDVASRVKSRHHEIDARIVEPSAPEASRPVRPGVGRVEANEANEVRRRRLRSMLRGYEEWQQSDWTEDWVRGAGLPGELPTSFPTIQSVGKRNADGSMTVGGFSIELGALPAGPIPAAISTLSHQKPQRDEAVVAPIHLGQPLLSHASSDEGADTVLPHPRAIARARAVSAASLPEPTASAAMTVQQTTEMPADHKAWVVRSAPLPAVFIAAQQISPSVTTQKHLALALPVREVVSHFPAVLPPAKVISTSPVTSVLSRAAPVTRMPDIAPSPRKCRPVLASRFPLIVGRTQPIDELDNLWTVIEQRRRRREEKERKRRAIAVITSTETSRPAATAIEARPAFRLKKRDPKNPDRLSPALLDHLADVALHPEWLQIVGRKIHVLGGSQIFTMRRQAWKHDREVLRLVAKVHVHATGGPDGLEPHIRSQVNEAIANKVRPADEGRPGGFGEGIGGIER